MADSDRKKDLRARILTLRESLSESDYVEMSKRISDRLESLPLWRHVSCVHVFWPMTKWREPDIRAFIRFLFRNDKRVVLPVVHTFSKTPVKGGRMKHVELESFSGLHQNEWGIAEPDGNTIVSEKEIDAVVVPALAVGRDGYRLGHGYGYYDEFLATIHVQMICPIFSRCVIEKVPHENHDIPVSLVVTEEMAIEVSKM